MEVLIIPTALVCIGHGKDCLIFKDLETTAQRPCHYKIYRGKIPAKGTGNRKSVVQHS